MTGGFMSRSGMEAPADGEQVTDGEWRRSPAQPVTGLTGSAYPPPALLSHNPLIAMTWFY